MKRILEEPEPKSNTNSIPNTEPKPKSDTNSIPNTKPKPK